MIAFLCMLLMCSASAVSLAVMFENKRQRYDFALDIFIFLNDAVMIETPAQVKRVLIACKEG